MGAYQEVRENASWFACFSLVPAGYIRLESASRDAPDFFGQIPLDGDCCVIAEAVHESFVAAWHGEELSVNCATNDQAPAPLRDLERFVSRMVQRIVGAQQSDDDIGVNGGDHAERLLAAQRAQPLLDAFTVPGNTWSADATILFEGAFISDRRDLYRVAVTFKQQSIPGSHAQTATNLARNRYLTFAGYFCLSAHRLSPIPYLTTELLTSQRAGQLTLPQIKKH